ncbi:hypothetical protein [Hyphobacterium sp.]|uniref:hypothetical protein n=1 Tax=Hyphobacterium sp. TaxID=2004662 RepID=UPI003BAC5691
MSPLVLITVSVVAISILVALNVWLGGWKPSRIPSAGAARQRLIEDYLAFEPGEEMLTTDKTAALIAEKDGDRTGLVVAQGDILVSRLISPSDVKSAEQAGSDLIVRFRDFTLPGVTLQLGSETTARQWRFRFCPEGTAHA